MAKRSAPKSSNTDKALALAKAGLSAIPVVGGPAVELFQMLIQPPLEKRRQEWMEQIGDDLQRLEKEGLKLNDLQSNPQFISAVMHASQIAMRSHEQLKRDALRNAVHNVAVGESPDETRLHLFLDLVDTLTVAHLRMLKLFHTPPQLGGVMTGGLQMVVEKGMPEMRGQRELAEQLFKQLIAHGLIAETGFNVTMTSHGLAAKRTTRYGDEFLDFISR